MLKVIGFLVLFALVMAGLATVLGWVIAHKDVHPQSSPALEEGSDYHGRVNDLKFGNISEDFATAIDPEREDEVYSDTFDPDRERGEFQPGNSVLSLTEKEIEHMRKADEREKARNASTQV